MWFFLMLVILLANGLSAFGLKVIVGWGLPGTVKFPYLTIWYAAGLASIGVPMLLKGVRLGRGELFWGAVMAALSIAGQVAMAVALDSSVPGNIVYPIAMGGSVFIVALASRFFFGERINRFSVIGVSLGLLAVILISISGS
jgi:small multidrug resistance pump